MRLQSSILVALSIGGSPLAGQQKLDPSRMYPITTPIKDAGTVDVTTGKWTKPGQRTKFGLGIIYNNTCTWMTQAYYAGYDWCQEKKDEGRIPSQSDPNSPSGALADNEIRPPPLSPNPVPHNLDASRSEIP